MNEWIKFGPLSSLEDQDVACFDYAERSFAIYRVDESVYATDGYCTHENAHLAEGLLLDCIIECPKHNGRFDIRNGRALHAPVRIDLKTYEVKIDGGAVYFKIDDSKSVRS
jgi:3-phenylpropionate/trans-cinnamate dioxygenase ferredoxin subunit